MTPHGRMNVQINRVQYVGPLERQNLRRRIDDACRAIFWVCFFFVIIFGLMYATSVLY